MPTYIKRGTNAWEFIGQYRPVSYKADGAVVKKHSGGREGVAGILFLERTDTASVDVRGGGFADPATRKAVEQAAVAAATAHYTDKGYKVESRETENLGYDLLATKGAGALYLEVKGTDDPGPRFFLTRNERDCAEQNANWRLVAVTQARTAAGIQVFTIKQIEKSYNLKPLAWECLPKV